MDVSAVPSRAPAPVAQTASKPPSTAEVKPPTWQAEQHRRTTTPASSEPGYVDIYA